MKSALAPPPVPTAYALLDWIGEEPDIEALALPVGSEEPDEEERPPRDPFRLLRRTLASRLFWMAVIGVVALLARIVAISTAYDIFIDEATYTNIAINVAHGRGLVLYGQPFALHPPAAQVKGALLQVRLSPVGAQRPAKDRNAVVHPWHEERRDGRAQPLGGPATQTEP